MNAKELILLNERAKSSEPYNSTRGIYADYSKGFDKPEFYCKCPNCRYVHGTYKTPKEAIAKRLCPLCDARGIEKLKKEVMTTESVCLAATLLEGDPLDDIIRARIMAQNDELRQDTSLSDLNALKNFDALNVRRNELIDKKYAGGLTSVEQDELKNLQRLAGLYRSLGSG